MSDINEWPGAEILCGCNVESLRVMRDPETGDIEFAIWQYGKPRVPWRQRVRAAWKCLRDGEPYGDQITLRLENAQRLAELLNPPPPVTWTISTSGSVSTYPPGSSITYTNGSAA